MTKWMAGPPSSSCKTLFFLRIYFAVCCVEIESVLLLNCTSAKIPTNSMVVKSLTYEVPFVLLILSEFPIMLTSLLAFYG
jgi:hypothetical protein